MTNLQGEDLCTPTFPDDDKNSTQSSLQQCSDSQKSDQQQRVSKKIKKNQGKDKLKFKDQKNSQKVSCPQCGKKYTNKYSLQTHLKTLHKIKPHVCEVCPNVSFWELKDLKHHMEKNHLDYLIEQCRIQKEKEDAEKKQRELEEEQRKNQLQQFSQQPQQQFQHQQYQNQVYPQQQYQQQGKNVMGYNNNFDMIIEQEENSSSTQSSNGNNYNNTNNQQQQFLDIDNMYPFNDTQQNVYNNTKPQFYQQSQQQNKGNNNINNYNQQGHRDYYQQQQNYKSQNGYAIPQNPTLYRTNSSQMTKEGLQNRIVHLQSKMNFYMQNKNINSLKKVQGEINYLIHCLKTKNYLPSQTSKSQPPIPVVEDKVESIENNVNLNQQSIENTHQNDNDTNFFINNNYLKSDKGNYSNGYMNTSNNHTNNSNNDCFLDNQEFNDHLQFENFIYE